MYRIIKSVIEKKDFKLEDILHKINKMYVESYISEEQKSELDELARENAKPENSYASADVRIEDIYKKLNEITLRLEKLENANVTDTEETTEEYPEFKQPSGSHDTYNPGDKITFNGKKYVCKLDACVWSPEAYPAGWEEVVESEG